MLQIRRKQRHPDHENGGRADTRRWGRYLHRTKVALV
jgi:hypothetical protein